MPSRRLLLGNEGAEPHLIFPPSMSRVHAKYQRGAFSRKGKGTESASRAKTAKARKNEKRKKRKVFVWKTKGGIMGKTKTK